MEDLMAKPFVRGKSLAVLPEASYLRMLADGAPTGGVDVWNRTLAEQAAVGRGPNVAAPATLKAPHVRRYAFDTHTTTNGKYDPSDFHKWLVHPKDGSRAPVNKIEGARGNEYGFFRTVVRSKGNERWHWMYILELDKKLWRYVQEKLGVKQDAIPGPITLKALSDWQRKHGLLPDAVPGPATLNKMAGTPAQPKPPVVVPSSGEVVVGTANFACYGKNISRATWRTMAEDVRAQGITLLSATETTATGRAEMMAKLGSGWKTWTVKGRTLAILFDSKEWDYGKPESVGPWDGFGHGAIAVVFTHRVTKVKLRFVSFHNQPKSVASKGTKLKRVKQMLGLTKGHADVIVAGDFALNSPEMPGFTEYGPNVDTMPKTAGTQSVDSVFGKGKKLRRVNGKTFTIRTSDHLGVAVKVRLGDGSWT